MKKDGVLWYRNFLQVRSVVKRDCFEVRVNVLYPPCCSSLEFEDFIGYNWTIQFNNSTTFLETFFEKVHAWIWLPGSFTAHSVCFHEVNHGCIGQSTLRTEQLFLHYHMIPFFKNRGSMFYVENEGPVSYRKEGVIWSCYFLHFEKFA